MPPAPDRRLDPDAAAQRVRDLEPGATGMVLGAPGTGKTTTLVARATALLTGGALAPDELLVLTPTRQTATALRDRLAAGVSVATPGPLARSLASFAFQLVRAAAVAAGEPVPQLLTAADQDGIIAELLAGDAEDAAAGADRWPAHLGPPVRASRAFRAELRALHAECVELALDPDELAALGGARDRPAWQAVGSFLREYRYAVARLRPAHRDPAQLVAEAAALLDSPTAALGAADRLRVLMLDDAQELTRGGVALIEAARRRGIAVLAFGDPDIASGAFRGAGPHVFDRLAAALGGLHVLDRPWRAGGSLTNLTRTVTAGIGAGSRIEHRRAPDASATHDGVTAVVAGSPFEEVDAIARTLRAWHLDDGIPWDELAVIAHDTRHLARLEAELAAREVPTRAASVPRPLGRESAVRDLVTLVRMGLDRPEERDPDELAELLLSPYGGLDSLGLRRLRARLRTLELADGGSRTARELLAEALREPGVLVLADTPEAERAGRLAETLAMIHADAARGATVHELLWIAWQRSGLEARWAAAATGQGVAAEEATRALDAVVAVFGAAKRSVERIADGSQLDGPRRFVRDILEAEVPEDLLAAPERLGAVSLLTPAAALGTEFEAVVIAGVQDGVWPNVRLRGGLLDGWRLVDEVDAWRSGAPAPPADAVDRRRIVLHDELRLFARAVSRARSRLVVTAVDDDDTGPSPLLRYLPEPEPPPGTGHPLTLRGLVAHHRRILTTSADPDQRRHSAGQLVLLADNGVPGAAPHSWYGVREPSTLAPVRALELTPVRVSPSRLEGFEACGLDWVVRALGGDTRSFSSGLGTILHAAMEAAPDGDRSELERVVDERWGELEFEAPWLERQERAWARTLVSRLHVYLRRVADAGGRVTGAEADFRLAIELTDDDTREPRVIDLAAADPPAGAPYAVLSGSIDRVEVYPPGAGEAVPASTASGDRAVVVDLKTGRSESRVSDAKVVEDAQLAAYQLAVEAGAVGIPPGTQNAGARLLVLSRTLKGTHYRIAHQPPLGPEERAAFLRRVVADARGMAAASFIANLDTHCADDRFAVCRLHTVKPVSAS